MTKMILSSAPIVKPMNCVVYVRVSSAEQTQNFSLDTQEELCRSYSQRTGYKVLEVFREEGESAKTADRPELLKLLDYCRVHRKNLASVVVYKFDRVARQTSDHLTIRAKLAEYGIKLESTTEPTDNSPAGKFMETLFAAVAQLDNEVRAERTKNGLYRRFQAGLATRPPLGYATEEVNGRRMPVKDEHFELVKRSWDLMATGTKSLSEIAKEMNVIGLTVNYNKTRKPITKQFASKLFHNKFYAGYLTSKAYPDQEVKGVHEPVVTEEVFYRVQAILDGRNQNPISTKRLTVNPLFPLRGVVKCSVCRGNLVSGVAHGRSRTYPKYWCPSGCVATVDARKLELMLREKLLAIQPNSDLVNAFTLYLKVKYDKRLNTLLELKKQADKRVLEQKEMLTMLVRGHMSGKYPDDIFEQEKVRIEDKLLAAQIVANDNLCEKYDMSAVVNFIRALFKDLAKAYETSEFGQKRVLLGSIYPSGLMFDGEHLLNRDLGPGFRAIQEFSSVGVNSSARKLTEIEPVLSSFRELILAYPEYEKQFVYA